MCVDTSAAWHVFAENSFRCIFTLVNNNTDENNFDMKEDEKS